MYLMLFSRPNFFSGESALHFFPTLMLFGEYLLRGTGGKKGFGVIGSSHIIQFSIYPLLFLSTSWRAPCGQYCFLWAYFCIIFMIRSVSGGGLSGSGRSRINLTAYSIEKTESADFSRAGLRPKRLLLISGSYGGTGWPMFILSTICRWKSRDLSSRWWFSLRSYEHILGGYSYI